MSHGHRHHHGPRVVRPVAGALDSAATFPVKVSQWRCTVRVSTQTPTTTSFSMVLPTKVLSPLRHFHISKALNQISWGAAILGARAYLHAPNAILLCANPGCGGPRWGGWNPNSQERCADCVATGFIGRVNEIQKDRIAKNRIEDAAALRMGLRFKITAWIHPAASEAYVLIWHVADPLSATTVQAVLKHEGSTNLTDWKQTELTS